MEAVDLLLLSSSDLFGFGDRFAEGFDGGDGVRSETVDPVVAPDGWRIEWSLGVAVVDEERVFGIRDIAPGVGVSGFVPGGRLVRLGWFPPWAETGIPLFRGSERLASAM